MDTEDSLHKLIQTFVAVYRNQRNQSEKYDLENPDIIIGGL